MCINTNNGVVEVRSTWGALCKASAFENGVSKQVEFSVFGLEVSGNNGNIVNVNPSSGEKSAFDFQINVKDTTGNFFITNILGVAPIPVTVVDIPTNTSSMVCDNVLNITQQVRCTLTPRDIYGLQIYAEAKIFSMTGIDIGLYPQSGTISWSALMPSVGNEFIVLGTFPYSSVFGATNGVTSQVEKIAALDFPDGTTIMSCVPPVVQAVDAPRCTINARKNNVPIVTSYTSFTISGSNKGSTFQKVRPDGSSFIDLGSLFSFDFVVGSTMNTEEYANTGIFAISNNISNVDAMITVIADPDTTSKMMCSSSQVVAGGQLRCVTFPQLQGQSIYAQTSIWVLNVEDKIGQQGSDLGTFSTITPSPAGYFFNWTLTANAIIKNQTFPFDITLNDGRSPIYEVRMVAPELPDSTSQMTCDPLTLVLGEVTMCTISVMKMNESVVSAANSFSVSDSNNGGTFSPLQPLAGKVLTFSYTPASKGSIPISNGLTPSPVLLFVSQATPTTGAPTAGAPSAPSAAVPSATPSVSLAPSAPSTPTVKVPTVSVPTSVKPPSNAPTPVQVPEDQGGLGAGVIILIVIAVLLMAAGGFFLYRRHQRGKVSHSEVEADDVGGYSAPHQI